jgi:hypothetical protein
VDLYYDGLKLTGELHLRADDPSPFVPFDAPLPVGTRLTATGEGAEREFKVARVQETGAPGMWLVPEVAAAPEKVAIETTQPERGPVPTDTDAGRAAKEGGRRNRNKKNRKTVTGH